MLTKKYMELYHKLKSEKHWAVIHCAAGIHRTGITAYILQRMFGFEEKASYENLKRIRIHTYEGVGDWWIELAENLFKFKLKKLIDGETEHNPSHPHEEVKEEEQVDHS